jgi:hypothetical protein
MTGPRPIRIEGDLAFVPLTRGYEAIIDAADVPLVEAWNWMAKPDRNTVYASRTDYSGPKPRTVLLHRALMGDPEGCLVDHRDGNGLNNRREGEQGNLRIASASQNQHNRGANKANTTNLKGVSRRKDRDKWHAKIRVDGKLRHLGSFDTPENAHAAYCAAATKLHSQFARTA